MDLSVICPVYNNAKTMLPMIASFQQQIVDGYSIEYIFICNGCTDNSEEILHQFVNMYPETFKNHIILHRGYGDVGHARQEGFEASTGNCILFCDMDDWLLSEYFFDNIIKTNRMYSNRLIKFGYDLPKRDYFYLENDRINYATYWHLKNRMSCTLWRYAFPREVLAKVHFTYGLSGKDDVDLLQQIEALGNIEVVTIARDYYFWNYLQPRSFSYQQMKDKHFLTKDQFLILANEILKNEPNNTEIKLITQHLL